MNTQNAQATWRGPLMEGTGDVALATSGSFAGPLSLPWTSEPGTNPEELIGAASASCFTMMFAKLLADAGHHPEEIATSAQVHTERSPTSVTITRIALSTTATVPGIDPAEFAKHAEVAEANCPVSRALAGTAITLDARLA